jgi:hypothetical protein
VGVFVVVARTLGVVGIPSAAPDFFPHSGIQVAPYSGRLTLDEFNSYCAENE